jgi:hypothetical protein
MLVINAWEAYLRLHNKLKIPKAKTLKIFSKNRESLIKLTKKIFNT